VASREVTNARGATASGLTCLCGSDERAVVAEVKGEAADGAGRDFPRFAD
jgi:hypothetical protein